MIESLLNLSKTFIQTGARTIRRHWLLSSLAALLVAVAMLGTPAWAGPVGAPLNQTVPLATPTPPVVEQAAPTATPLPDDPEDETDEPPQPSEPASPAEPSQPGASPDESDEPEDPDSVPFTMPGDSADTAAETEGILTAVVTAATLNVREGPGTAYPVIGTFTANQEVVVEARNEANSWWHVCCLDDAETRGWVSAPLLAPNFDREQSAQLLAIFGAEAQAATAAQPTPIPAETTSEQAATGETQPISLTVSHAPNFIWQGKTFDIQFTVSNPNDAPLSNLQVSDELPPGLIFVEAAGEGNPRIVERETPTGQLIIFRWTTLPADATVNATITATVDPTLPDGFVIDNLAAARATNGEYTTDAITLGLPPTSIPDFQ